MVKYKIGGKTYNDKRLYAKAKKMNKAIYGSQQAAEYLKRKGYKIKFWNTRTKNWNIV